MKTTQDVIERLPASAGSLTWRAGAIAGLKHAVEVCRNRRNSPCKNESFRAGCEDAGIFIAAALERLEAGEIEDGGSMWETAVCCSANVSGQPPAK